MARPKVGPRSYPRVSVGDILGGNYSVQDVSRDRHHVRVIVYCTDCGYLAEMPDFHARKGHVRCPGARPDQPDRQLHTAIARAMAGTDQRPLWMRALWLRALSPEGATTNGEEYSLSLETGT